MTTIVARSSLLRRLPACGILAASILVLFSGTARGQLQFTELSKVHLPLKDNDSSDALALGDVDGDGDPDLVCATSGAASRLYLNNGKGLFTDVTAQRMPKDGNVTSALALGDVDGDGDLDLVCADYRVKGQHKLYLNDGKGTFTDATATKMPKGSNRTTALAMGDVDADGDLDLVLGNKESQNKLYLNDGKGKFTDVTSAKMPKDLDATYAVALGDVDGDGDADLICANDLGQNKLYLNDGKGKFTDTTATKIPKDKDWSRALALGDVDGDRDLDLVFGNILGQNKLYLNNGKGKFTDATATKIPKDKDRSRALVLGDVDGDGDPDLISGIAGAPNKMYLNDGRGKFTVVPATMMSTNIDTTLSLVLADVDGDGDRDLLCGNFDSQNKLYLNGGKGKFADATAAKLPTAGSISVALGDVDGDGDPDLVSGGFMAQNRLYLNDGKGSFSDVTTMMMPKDNQETAALALGDVDGDGDLDLICGNNGTRFDPRQNKLYLNDGKGKFTDVTATQMPRDSVGTAALALGDVDGDGDLDLVCGNEVVRDRLYLNDGKGKFIDVTATMMPDDREITWSLALGDVDRDGDLDLLCGSLGGQNRLYLNSGKGKFTNVTATQMPKDRDLTTSLALGDVDGDGDLDLICGNISSRSGQESKLYLNDRTGKFTEATTQRFPRLLGGTTSLALGDVDGDGDLDLVCGLLRQNRLYLNKGAGVFVDVTTAKMPKNSESTTALALGDVDGDGDPDLVCGNHDQSKVYVNLRRQIDAPYLAILGRDYRLDIYAYTAGQKTPVLAVPFLASAQRKTPVPPLGIWGLEPSRMIALSLVVIPSSTGKTSVLLPVPNNARLIGTKAYSQALIIPGLASPTIYWRFTNVNAEICLKL